MKRLYLTGITICFLVLFLAGAKTAGAQEAVGMYSVSSLTYNLTCNESRRICGAHSSFARPSCEEGDIQLDALNLVARATGEHGIAYFGAFGGTPTFVKVTDGYVPGEAVDLAIYDVRIVAVCANTTVITEPMGGGFSPGY